MSLKNNIQASESYITVLKRHFMVMIIFPICLIFFLKLAVGLQIKSDHLLLKSITGYMAVFGIISLSLFTLLVVIICIFKRKFKKVFYIIFNFIITILTLFVPVFEHGIDTDWINIFLYKNEYLHIMENQPSIATDGGKRLVKIQMHSNWNSCHSNIVYDESDELSA